MPKLDLKIPPPVVMIIVGAAMWLISKTFPGIPVDAEIKRAAFGVMALIGVLFAATGIRSFKKAKTTINPTTPGSASSLVTSGVYKFTRNPMYVGLLCVLIGWGVFLANLFALAFIACFVFYMNRFQIGPEERALESLFGDAFTAYKIQVRRWL